MHRTLGFAVVIFSCSFAFGAEREWKIGGRPIRAELVGGEPDIVYLKHSDGKISSVTLDELSASDKTFAWTNLGTQLIAFSGIWRDGLGGYNAFSESRDGKVYTTTIDDSDLISADAVLVRKDKSLVAEQLIAVFRGDPSRKPRQLGLEVFVAADGAIRMRYDILTFDRNGRESRKRRKGTTSLVRMDPDQVPKNIMEKYLKLDSRGPEELYQSSLDAMVEVVGIHWYAKQRKISIADAFNGRTASEKPTFGEHVVNTISLSVRNRMVHTIVDRLFPVYRAEERKLVEDVIIEYLDEKDRLQRLDRDSVERWVAERIEKAATERKLRNDILRPAARFIAEAHERVMKSFVSKLPDNNK